MKRIVTSVLVAALVGPAALARASETVPDGMKKSGDEATLDTQPGDTKDQAVKKAGQAIEELKRVDPGLDRFFDHAVGYAVFPTVGKGAIGIGGAHGTGVLYEKGIPTGKASITQLTVGPQLGGQAYTEVIFFKTKKVLKDFKKGEYAVAAEVSAVVAASGASANAKYVDDVSIFALPKGGAMAEASVGGQKFTYTAFPTATVTSSE